MNPAIGKELERRIAVEREKAVRKYGDGALLPCGRPDFDVADYCINELVGLIRYAEMLANRADLMDKLFEGDARRKVLPLIREQEAFARDLTFRAEDLAKRLIYIRQRLVAKGLHLGMPE